METEKLRFVIWEAVPDSEIAQEVISDLGVYETHHGCGQP